MAQLSLFTGSRRKGVYRQWKREVQVYKAAFNVNEEQLAPRVWLRLGGEARDAVEHLEIETDLAQKGGLEKLWEVLDPLFGQEECDRVDEAVSAFWTHRREYGQTMEMYMSLMHQLKGKMEKEDPETKIGDKAYAVRLLRRAGLSKSEQATVLSATGTKYVRALIEAALRRL